MEPSKERTIAKKVGHPYHRIDWDERKKQIAEMREAGFSDAQIAKYFGVSVGAINYWRRGRDDYLAKRPPGIKPRLPPQVLGSMGGLAAAANRRKKMADKAISDAALEMILGPALPIIRSVFPAIDTLMREKPEAVFAFLQSPMGEAILKRLPAPDAPRPSVRLDGKDIGV